MRPLADLLGKQIADGKTVLIIGETSTGKTTVLRVLANAIPEDQRMPKGNRPRNLPTKP
jgi:pilus assembly protein CpaF